MAPEPLKSQVGLMENHRPHLTPPFHLLPRCQNLSVLLGDHHWSLVIVNPDPDISQTSCLELWRCDERQWREFWKWQWSRSSAHHEWCDQPLPSHSRPTLQIYCRAAGVIANKVIYLTHSMYIYKCICELDKEVRVRGRASDTKGRPKRIRTKK